MKKLIFSFFALLLFSLSFAQRVTVSEKDETIDKMRRTGLSTTLELDKKLVRDQWKKQLKDYGKLDKSGNIYILESARIPTLSSNPVKIYSTVESSGGGTTVWYAIDMGDSFIKSGHSKYRAAEQLLHDFGVTCYKEDIQEQIADAEKAVGKATKDYEGVVDDGEDLKNDLVKNADEKKDLEQQLENNAKNKIQIEKDIEQNKKDQTQAQQEVDKMKKALEVVKQKLNNVQ